MDFNMDIFLVTQASDHLRKSIFLLLNIDSGIICAISLPRPTFAH